MSIFGHHRSARGSARDRPSQNYTGTAADYSHHRSATDRPSQNYTGTAAGYSHHRSARGSARDRPSQNYKVRVDFHIHQLVE